MNKAFKVRLYPNKSQKHLIDKTIGSCRFIYNQMLNERIEVYEKLKDDKEILFQHKYKTEKQYKEEFTFLKEVSSRGLQQSRMDLNQAYKNFYRRIRQGKKAGFPKFKAKHKSPLSYREPQVGSSLRVEDNKITLLKLGKVKLRGLSRQFSSDFKIKSVTVSQSRTGKFFASILTEYDLIPKKRKSDNNIGIDLGLKEFATCSNGEQIKGIQKEVKEIESKIKTQQRHIARKKKGSNRRKKAILKLNKIHEYKTNFMNHFQWNLVNKLCSENQAISLEDLNILGMRQNKKLSHSIQLVNWGGFLNKLEQKSHEYGTEIYKIDRWFPSSKLCSKCGSVKENLSLSERQYSCDCGLDIDRDLNASFNILNYFLNQKSLEYSDYKHGENVRPRKVDYHSSGQFSTKCLKKVS